MVLQVQVKGRLDNTSLARRCMPNGKALLRFPHMSSKESKNLQFKLFLLVLTADILTRVLPTTYNPSRICSSVYVPVVESPTFL